MAVDYVTPVDLSDITSLSSSQVKSVIEGPAADQTRLCSSWLAGTLAWHCRLLVTDLGSQLCPLSYKCMMLKGLCCLLQSFRLCRTLLQNSAMPPAQLGIQLCLGLRGGLSKANLPPVCTTCVTHFAS